MGTFVGLVLLAIVVGYYLRKLTRVIGAIGIVFERTVNVGSMRSGHPPITTKADEEQFL